MTVIDALQSEHAVLLPRIEELRTLAEAIDGCEPEAIAHDVDRAYELLVHHVVPHAMAEDHVLYPEVERVMNAPGATATMSRDHVEIERLTSQLETIREALAEGGPLLAGRRIELRRILYALHAVLKLHVAKEEEVYAPLLDAALDAAAAERLFAAMDTAVREAKTSLSAFEHDAA